MTRTNWPRPCRAVRAVVSVWVIGGWWSLAVAQPELPTAPSVAAQIENTAPAVPADPPCQPGQHSTLSAIPNSIGERNVAYDHGSAGAALAGDRQGASAPGMAASDCPEVQLRPAAPDMFGRAAAPIGALAFRHDWSLARDLTLNGTERGLDELLGQANSLTGGNPLDMVNRWVNWHLRYVDDSDGDIWSGAAETLGRGFGDCEDFAIAKMAILQRLGIPLNDMFLVLVRKAERPFDHAVLAVRREGSMYILDNMNDYLRVDGQIVHYVPTLSYSGDFAWIYGSRAANDAEPVRIANPAEAAPNLSVNH